MTAIRDADDDGVWCKCGGQMRAIEGRKFPGARKWIWWTCSVCGDSSSPAMPLPRHRNLTPA